MDDYEKYNEENLLEMEGLGQFLVYECEGGYELEIVTAYTKREPIEIIKHIVIPREYNGIPIKKLSAYNFNGEAPGASNEVLSITVPDSVEVLANAFQDFTEIEEIELPSSIRKMAHCTFQYCYSLKRVKIPKGVTLLGISSFYWCQSLEQVELPDTLIEIGERAFAYCMSLPEIRIPASVVSIGDKAFEFTDSLSNIIVDENNPSYRTIDGSLYSKDGKTLIKYAQGKPDETFYVPEGVEKILEGALDVCCADGDDDCALRRVVLPKSLLSLNDRFIDEFDEPKETDDPELLEVAKLYQVKIFAKK